MRVNVSDDEVLQAMSKFNIDAEELTTFRYFRNLMKQGVPLCCIAFMHFYVNHAGYMSEKRMDEILCDENSKGLRLNVAVGKLMDNSYYFAARDKAGFNLNYTPCPACVLATRFVDVPPVCACCADEAEHPAP